MDPIDLPPPPRVMTLADFFAQCGFVGPILVFAAITLIVWSLILLFKTRLAAYYYSFIAAALWPLCLGMLGAIWVCRGALTTLGDNEFPDLELLYGHLLEATNPLVFGSFLTCLFFQR